MSTELETQTRQPSAPTVAELMTPDPIVVDESATVALLMAQLEPLLASARKANPADERWQHEAEQRARLARIWPTLVG